MASIEREIFHLNRFTLTIYFAFSSPSLGAGVNWWCFLVDSTAIFQKLFEIFKTLRRKTSLFLYFMPRACLHGGGRPQVSGVTH